MQQPGQLGVAAIIAHSEANLAASLLITHCSLAGNRAESERHPHPTLAQKRMGPTPTRCPPKEKKGPPRERHTNSGFPSAELQNSTCPQGNYTHHIPVLAVVGVSPKALP